MMIEICYLSALRRVFERKRAFSFNAICTIFSIPMAVPGHHASIVPCGLTWRDSGIHRVSDQLHIYQIPRLVLDLFVPFQHQLHRNLRKQRFFLNGQWFFGWFLHFCTGRAQLAIASIGDQNPVVFQARLSRRFWQRSDGDRSMLRVCHHQLLIGLGRVGWQIAFDNYPKIGLGEI